MTKKELIEVMRPFINTIDLVIKVKGIPYYVSIHDAKYIIDAHGNEHVELIPFLELKHNV